MNALDAEGLNTYYGKSHILHDVGLIAAEGKITTVLGRNGAGKTTTMKTLMGLVPARTGRVQVFGTDTTRMPPYRVVALGVGYVPEGRRIFPNLTVDENLRVPLERPGPWTMERVYELFPRLASRKTNRGRQLSGGEQEMLSIARALLINPRLLILDEPSQGLAPLIVREVFRIVAQMRDRRHLRHSGRAECARQPRDCRPCLRIGERRYGLFGSRRRTRSRRGTHPGVGWRIRRGVVPGRSDAVTSSEATYRS